jgi:xanthine dehydrogenase YagR molybdenum-binding subunit
MSVIGAHIDRVDGRQKVTGAAKYSAEFRIPNLAYAVLIESTIPSGSITSMDTSQAERVKGVLAVLTPASALKLPKPERRLSLLQDSLVHYNNQPIGVVVANSLNAAWYAASLVRVRYRANSPRLDFKAGFANSYPGNHNEDPGDASWGDVDGGLAQAEIKVDQIYTTPIQHHSPMEPHAAIAQWDGDHLTLYASTQNITGNKQSLANIFGIPESNVRVICLFVGGGFGCKGQLWSHVPLAVMAAKKVNRPVKLVLERPQMFGPVGARPQTYQRVTLGSTRNGKLTAIRHEVHTNTSFLEDYLESSAVPTRIMYACPNVSTKHRLVQLSLGTPTYTRAPGVATGTYALEVAMDELAYRLKMDPLQLRLLNYADVEPQTKRPFTEKSLRDCYMRAAERFGWARRTHEPRSMRSGSLLRGWGMATETYPAKRLPAAALVRFRPNGRVLVASGTHELGTGMYTILTQVAADSLGMSPDLIDAQLGDTVLPQAPISAGSMSVASVTPAVQFAAAKARLKLLAMAVKDVQSPVYGARVDEVDFKDGNIFRNQSPAVSEHYAKLLARNGNAPVEATARATPNDNEQQFSSHSFGAVFVEVTVDLSLGMVRVPRVVAVYDIGKLLNEKTGKSQFIGGIVWGISLALHEDTHVDPTTGRIANANLAEYHVPVNADIGEIDVSVVDLPDTKLNPLGARGIGEIGITGTGAAVANAVYHATGKRIRDLPITPDKLLVEV